MKRSILLITLFCFTLVLNAQISAKGKTLKSSIKTPNITAGKGVKTVCDTVMPPVFYTSTCSNDLTILGGGPNGFMTGNNIQGDLEKAQRFMASGGNNRTVSSVLVYAITEDGTTDPSYVRIYSVDSATLSPSTLLATSDPLALSNINSGGFTEFTFASPVTVPADFFVSVVLPTATGDTLAVLSTYDGCFSYDSLSWEMHSDLSWHSIAAARGFNFEMVIFPMVCSASNAPGANFIANPTNITQGNSVHFTDLSTGAPNSWLWNILPATGWAFINTTTSASQNPKIYFNDIGSYTISLTVTNNYSSNTLTKIGYINVTDPGAFCDTLVTPSFIDTCGSFETYTFPNCQGYLTGNNVYGHLEKAGRFKAAGGSGKTVSTILVYAITMAGTTNPTYMKLYAVNPSTLAPSTLLGTSNPVALSNINPALVTAYTFPSPVLVPNDFYVSVVLPTNTADTLVVISNSASCSSSDSTAWELWNDGTWHSFNSAYAFNTDLYILPVVCPPVTGCSALFSTYADTSTQHHYYIVNMAAGVPPISYLWDWGDGSFDSIPYPSHSYNTPGNYTICLSINDSTGCTSTFCDSFYLQKQPFTTISLTVVPYSGTGISENQSNSYLGIYPNPASASITIELTSYFTKNTFAEIYSMQGKLLKHISMQQEQTQVNISDLPSGVYIVKVSDNSGIAVKRIIKE
jgi:PKD repeat protein